MRIGSIALALVASAAACSTFGDETDDEQRPGPPTPDAGAADAEAGGPTDGGPNGDGAVPADATSSSFCSAYDASSFLFCRDFDDGLPAAYGFIGKGGAPLLDTTTSKSPATAMWAQTGGTYLRYDTTAASSTKQHAHAAMYLGNFGAPIGDPRDVVVLRILQAPGLEACVHELAAKVDAASLDVRSPTDGGTVNTTHPFGKFLLTRRWTDVDVVLDQDLSAVNVTVSFDGVVVLASRRTTCASLSSNVQVFVGLVTSSPGEARFDDFVFGSY